jgi:hypothetical protein
MPSFRRGLKYLGYGLLLLIGLPMVAFAAGVLWPRQEPRPPVHTGPFAITSATVIDVRSGERILGQTIVVEGNRISAVGPDVQVPAGMRSIDGRGKFVMPALWDMHTHVYAISPLLDMPLYIAYGVTNVRDLQGCPAKGDPFIACYEDKTAWSKEAIAGRRVGPRIIEASSFMANGPGMAARLGNVPEYFDTSTDAQARAFVGHFVGKADSIKVYDRIPRPAYRALADEAAKRGLPLVGHKPRAISTIEASRHQRSLEHARFILHDSFDGSDALREAAGTTSWKEDRRAMVDRHDPAKADAIFAAMRANGTYYVPTHLTRWSDAYAETPAVREDPALVYLHPLMKMQWLEDLDNTLAVDPGPEARKAYVDFYEKGLELTGKAQAAGVKIMVGTDYIAPGLDVHRELEQLVRAGLSPQQALTAATLTPAEYAGLSAEYSAVAPGRIADILVLSADPLLDIRNTQRIEAVVFNGVLYGDDAIAALKKRVTQNARSWTVGAKILWRFIKNPANY